MKAKFYWIVPIAAIAILLVSVTVASAMLIPAADKAKDKAKVDNSPVIEKIEIEGEDHLALTPPGLERIVFIHYRKGFAKPPWAGGGKKEPECYDLLGKWVKWQELPVSYVIHTDLEAAVSGAVFASAETWDDATSQELFDGYTVENTASWDGDAPDGENELVFGDYPEEGVIAVTIVWGYFSGPPSTRKIVEFDIMFDTDYNWYDCKDTTCTEANKGMDLQNIATHEIGHGAGLGDVYDTVCSEVTMYGYSNYGETQKRDLETSDITGIQELYGK